MHSDIITDLPEIASEDALALTAPLSEEDRKREFAKLRKRAERERKKATKEAEATTPPSRGHYDFPDDFITRLLALRLRDTAFTTRTDGLIKPEYFATVFDQAIVHILDDYFESYKSTPDRTVMAMLIKDAVAAKRIRDIELDDVEARVNSLFELELDAGDHAFEVEKVATWARHQAMTAAILESAHILGGKGDFDKIEKKVKTALLVGEDMSSDDFDFYSDDDFTDGLDSLSESKKDGIATGFDLLDRALLHRGWGKQELSTLMGGPKVGKSMALGEFAKNAALAGHNVLLFTCEVSRKIYRKRLYANIADIRMNSLGAHKADVEKAYREYQKKSASIYIQERPSGTLTPAQIERAIEYYAAKGINFDLMVIDYADIMAPNYRSREPIADSKQIWLDLRAIAQKYNLAVLTATQTNRVGAKAAKADVTHVADDFNKIRTADLVISITPEDKKMIGERSVLTIVANRNGPKGTEVPVTHDFYRAQFIKRTTED